jgi:hypothetical protein
MPAGARQRLGFSVGLVGEDGQEAKDSHFSVTAVGPAGEKVEVPVRLKAGEYRGEFDQANTVGEYSLEVKGTGTGKGGKQFAAGPVSARFMAFSEDIENQRPAADHKSLARIAQAGGGTFRIAGKEELLRYLGELRDRTSSQGWVRREVWPNWKYLPASETAADQLTALVASGTLPCLALFIILISAEWILRRVWGLV